METDEEQPPKSYLGPLGVGFGILGICLVVGIAVFCVFMYWLANHFVDGID